MAATKAKPTFYVYAIMDGNICLYVGKGSGRRHKVSQRKHGGKSVILEEFNCETTAFRRERDYIAELMPTENVAAGGGGGRKSPKLRYDLPESLIGIVSKPAWRKELLTQEREMASTCKRSVAKFLLTKIDLRNCEKYGVSKVDVSRLREVAYV